MGTEIKSKTRLYIKAKGLLNNPSWRGMIHNQTSAIARANERLTWKEAYVQALDEFHQTELLLNEEAKILVTPETLNMEL